VAIHEAGVVHRDIKPENVLITKEHVVKVMDLGVARLKDEAVRLSQAGGFVGSLEYAAPEQFRSADGEPDGRADLHALGVMLYELATGQHPYRDEDASRVLRNILDVTPRKAGEVNPQLSPFFEELVQTLIAKDPAARLADAQALVGVLEEGEQGAWWKERAKALRIETKQPLRRIRIPRETALYGREQDLERLHALYERAKSGEGRVLLIEGEAGIGKTRLVDEFVGRLRQEGEDLNFLFGSYPPGGAATASGAFSTAYREQFGPQGSGDYLPQTPLLVAAFDALLKGDATPTGAEPLTKDSLQTVFVHATQALAQERPTVVLIDDLHFAPEDGRALFASLALAVPGHRVLLLGTMRPGVSQEWIANVERLDHAGRSALSRLGPKDLFALLKDSFRSERLAEELGMRISIKCDGNPFFAFEIIRGLREGQFISQRPDGTWVTTRVIQDIQVPSSVLDLVNARVADLSQEERDLLDVAACWGFEFNPLLVGDVLDMKQIPLMRLLAQVEKKHRLVRAAGRRFVFDHHQVQEALYSAMPELLREPYHAALAEALETRAGAAGKAPEDLDGALAVDLCEQFLKGARGEQALGYLEAALGHLEKGYLNDQAVALAGRALAVPGLLQGARRAKVLLRVDARLDLLGRRQAQEGALEEAAALAEAEDDEALRAQVAQARGGLLWSTGRPQEARAHQERALSIFRELGDRKGEASATTGLGKVFWSLGRFEEARAHFERALSIQREVGDRSGEANATMNLGNLFYSLGRYEEARAHHERALSIFREVGDRSDEGYALLSLASLADEEGQVEEARRLARQSLDLRREIGHGDGVAESLLFLGDIERREGNAEEARALLEESLSLSREQGRKAEVALALALLCRLPAGDAAAAAAALEEAGEAGNTSEVRFHLFQATGKPEHLSEARRLLEESVQKVSEEYRASMLENVRLNREIVEAWEANR
jgi:tetratricopeptide (TPR) repeat protein